MANKGIREGSVKKGGVNPPTNTPRPKGKPHGQRAEPDFGTMSPEKFAKLTGGPLDGEKLCDTFMARRDEEFKQLKNRIEILDKIVTRLVMSQPRHRSWWRRVSDAWHRSR